MDWSAQLASVFRLGGGGWARHANPISGWTRIPILPVGAAILLAREELGIWTVPLLGLLVLWAFVNPTAFPPPADDRSWMSRAVLGEKIWVEARNGDGSAAVAEIGPATWWLNLLQFSFLFPLVWGLWLVSPVVAAFGTAGVLAGKLAFLRLMVRLYDTSGTLPPPPIAPAARTASGAAP
ncbi:MAG: DUF6653 family protein [Pseudomonadota bacterium]